LAWLKIIKMTISFGCDSPGKHIRRDKQTSAIVAPNQSNSLW
jgi:hypothetical protein